MRNAFANEPARIIGVALALILAVVSTLLGEGVISDAIAGRITDIATSAAGLLVLLVPILTGELIRSQVTPTAAPNLPMGTVVNGTDAQGDAALGKVTRV